MSAHADIGEVILWAAHADIGEVILWGLENRDVLMSPPLPFVKNGSCSRGGISMMHAPVCSPLSDQSINSRGNDRSTASCMKQGNTAGCKKDFVN